MISTKRNMETHIFRRTYILTITQRAAWGLAFDDATLAIQSHAQCEHDSRLAKCCAISGLGIKGGCSPLTKGAGGFIVRSFWAYLDIFDPREYYQSIQLVESFKPARRELQNPCGEMKIGDFFDF